MLPKRLTVEISNRPNSMYLRARIIQHDSNGPVYGRDLLADRTFRDRMAAADCVAKKYRGILAHDFDFNITADEMLCPPEPEIV